MKNSCFHILLFWMLASEIKSQFPKRFRPPYPAELTVLKTTPKQIDEALKKFKVIPDLVKTSPRLPVMVEWIEDEAEFGNVIETEVLELAPFWVQWKCKEYDWHTVIMLGLDEPTPDNPINREFQFWIVGNIEGYLITFGETVTHYIQPKPQKDAGPHRIAVIVYRQPTGRIVFSELPLTEKDFLEKRANFSHEKFAKKYNLSKPMAINFFMSQHETLPPF